MTTITSIIQKTRTWRKFSLYQRYLLLQALILLPLIHLSLNVWGFQRTYSILGNIGNIGNGDWGIVKNENSISSQILTTVSMVKIAAKYYKWATCLRKSLALWFLLNLIGKRNRYLIGHLFSYIFKPNSRDLEYIFLPRFMYILYYVIRPIRLSLKFLNP